MGHFPVPCPKNPLRHDPEEGHSTTTGSSAFLANLLQPPALSPGLWSGSMSQWDRRGESPSMGVVAGEGPRARWAASWPSWAVKWGEPGGPHGCEQTGLCLSERWESRRAIPGMSCLCPQTRDAASQEDQAPGAGSCHQPLLTLPRGCGPTAGPHRPTGAAQSLTPARRPGSAGAGREDRPAGGAGPLAHKGFLETAVASTNSAVPVSGRQSLLFSVSDVS